MDARDLAVNKIVDAVGPHELAWALLDAGAALVAADVDFKDHESARKIALAVHSVMVDADLPSPFDDIVSASFWRSVES